MQKDYVNDAEQVILSMKQDDRTGKLKITTSQIRQILSLANVINNKILEQELKDNDQETLSDPIVNLIKSMEIKLVYQAGRDNDVKNFITKSKLREKLKAVGKDRFKFKEFFSYLEALVAFHRFHGGKE